MKKVLVLCQDCDLKLIADDPEEAEIDARNHWRCKLDYRDHRVMVIEFTELREQ